MSRLSELLGDRLSEESPPRTREVPDVVAIPVHAELVPSTPSSDIAHGFPVEEVCELLKSIRKISSQIQADMNPYDACLEARRSFELYHQTDKMDLAMHLQNFKHLADCADQAGDGLFQAQCLAQYEREQDRGGGVTEVTDDEYDRRVRERLMSISFLKKANMRVYGDLIDDLRDQFLFKQDVYPRDHAICV